MPTNEVAVSIGAIRDKFGLYGPKPPFSIRERGENHDDLSVLPICLPGKGEFNEWFRIRIGWVDKDCSGLWPKLYL